MTATVQTALLTFLPMLNKAVQPSPTPSPTPSRVEPDAKSHAEPLANVK